MTSRWKLLVICLGAVVASRPAWAGTSFVLNVQIANGQPTTCALEKSPIDGDDTFQVSLKDRNSQAVAASDTLTVSLTPASGSVTSVQIPTSKTSAQAESGNYTHAKYALSNTAGPLPSDTKCTGLLDPPPEATTKDSPAPPPPVTIDASELNQQARDALMNLKIADHEVSGGVLGKHYRLYHLPDGTPAFPLPAHINEKDDVRLLIVVPVGSKTAVDVVACDKVPGYRIKGSYKDASSAAGKLQGRAPLSKAPLRFVIEPYQNVLKCSGTLTYKIETSGTASGSTTTSISIDPVYRFEWGVGYGFDFGRPKRFSLGDRPAAGGTGTEKFIVQDDSYTGAKPLITLGVDVCGTNPEAMTWCDHLLMPTIWVDPTRLSDGFGVGLVIRPIYGVGILAGMSVFESQRLADGVTGKPGDAWGAAGDLPTKKVWNRDSLGLMLGATLDTGIFAALVP